MGINTGTGTNTFSYVPDNGDIITCIALINDNAVISNEIVMNVSPCNNLNITVSTPGTLNTVINSCLKTVINLTINGTIDARDFKTLRDSMPLLSVLNLNNVTIVAYNGNEGTENYYSDNSAYYYPANAIPQFAFSSQRP